MSNTFKIAADFLYSLQSHGGTHTITAAPSIHGCQKCGDGDARCSVTLPPGRPRCESRGEEGPAGPRGELGPAVGAGRGTCCRPRLWDLGAMELEMVGLSR